MSRKSRQTKEQKTYTITENEYKLFEALKFLYVKDYPLGRNNSNSTSVEECNTMIKQRRMKTEKGEEYVCLYASEYKPKKRKEPRKPKKQKEPEVKKEPEQKEPEVKKEPEQKEPEVKKEPEQKDQQ